MDYEILMINISRDFSGYSKAFRESIGQYLIASYLRKNDFKAYVYAGDVLACKSVIENELRNGKTQVVGFYAAADNIRVVSNAIRWIKDNFPECVTVVGGPQAIGLDYDFFEETGNDYAILGEGEIPMHYLLSSLIDHILPLEKVPSLVYRDSTDKKLVVNWNEDAIVMDLDQLGFPMIEDSLTGTMRQGEVVGIITGRGCPYQCAFCYEGANAKKVRLRSVSSVMEEIDYIAAHNKRLNFISIYDDTFTLNQDRILEFCEEIDKRKIMWFCEGHISFVVKHPDIIKRMIEAGLTCIQFGIESGSQKVLDAYNKHTDTEMIISAIEICKKLGIHSITGNFIIGGAFESRETIEESKRLAKELIHRAKGIIELYTVYYAPYPNTRITREPELFDIDIHEDIKKINLNTMRTPVVSTSGLERNEIYDIKHEFDEFLAQEYKKAVEESSKMDVIQGLYHDGTRISVNPTWERMYMNKTHISTFLEHLGDDEQRFDKDKFIIRTFEDIKIEDGKMFSDVGVFEGIEMYILMYATGIYTAAQMAEQFHVSIDTIEHGYLELNNRCLVYMTMF